MMRTRSFHLKPLALALSALMLSGCATFSDDGGLNDVSRLTSERTGQPVQPMQDSTRAAVTQLMTQPLSPDDATKIALLNNRGLQASLAYLGVAEADLVQAGRLRNPGLSFSRKSGGDVDIDRGIMFDLTGLLTMPLRRSIETGRFEQAKLDTAAQAVQLAFDTRKAYFNAVAARQSMVYAMQVASAAQAGAELAQRLASAGNWSRLDQKREQVFYAEATAQLARASHQALATRERLTVLMGLWGDDTGDTGYTLPERLPDLPPAATEMTDIEAQAIAQRLDIRIAKRNAEALAGALGLSQATGFINVFDIGYVNKSASGQARANGYAIALELPIFDWGTARNRGAEALYMQALHHTAEIAIKARSEVRVAYAGYRSGFDLARHYRDEVLPLRQHISKEVLLRYNGMLAGVFELLSDSRDQINSVNATIAAQRDFWIADTELQAALSGKGSASDNNDNNATQQANIPPAMPAPTH
jgi:outer membrane protein TolC